LILLVTVLVIALVRSRSNRKGICSKSPLRQQSLEQWQLVMMTVKCTAEAAACETVRLLIIIIRRLLLLVMMVMVMMIIVNVVMMSHHLLQRACLLPLGGRGGLGGSQQGLGVMLGLEGRV
jgi:hypothetical protein